MEKNNVITTKADKGCFMVPINKEDYMSKMDKLIKQPDIEEQQKDPTEDYVKSRQIKRGTYKYRKQVFSKTNE